MTTAQPDPATQIAQEQWNSIFTQSVMYQIVEQATIAGYLGTIVVVAEPDIQPNQQATFRVYVSRWTQRDSGHIQAEPMLISPHMRIPGQHQIALDTLPIHIFISTDDKKGSSVLFRLQRSTQYHNKWEIQMPNASQDWECVAFAERAEVIGGS
ncbi:MAG TPA: hypothetical protein VMX38_06800 [Verrucomicrobiae bacterium]|nr:hypothetical protein [Verrucomicrobiae bacterium]